MKVRLKFTVDFDSLNQEAQKKEFEIDHLPRVGDWVYVVMYYHEVLAVVFELDDDDAPSSKRSPTLLLGESQQSVAEALECRNAKRDSADKANGD